MKDNFVIYYDFSGNVQMSTWNAEKYAWHSFHSVIYEISFRNPIYKLSHTYEEISAYFVGNGMPYYLQKH